MRFVTVTLASLLMLIGIGQAAITSGSDIVENFDYTSAAGDFFVIRDDTPSNAGLGIASGVTIGTGATPSGALTATDVGTGNTSNDIAVMYAPGGVSTAGKITLGVGETLEMSVKFKVKDNTEAATPRFGVASYVDVETMTSGWTNFNVNSGKDVIGNSNHASGIAVNLANSGAKSFNIVNSIYGSGRTLIPDPAGNITLVDDVWYQFIIEITKSTTVNEFDVTVVFNQLTSDGTAVASQLRSFSDTVTNIDLYTDGDFIAGLTIVHDGDPDTVTNNYDDMTIAIGGEVPTDPVLTNVSPGYQSVGRGLEPELTWTVANAASPTFDINIGTTVACDEIISAVSTGSAMSYTPAAGLLDYATEYFWRADVTDGGTEYAGTAWSFTTGGKATSPVPSSGGTADRSAGVLSWSGDALINTYDVWFGVVGNLQFVGNYVVTSVSYADLATVLGETVIAEGAYQWRVDTVDDNSNLMVTGDVWDVSFSEITPVVIEDYEDNDTLAGWSAGGGATIAFESVYNSMLITYSGASDATLSFSPSYSFSASGMDTFVVSFLGSETNDASGISLTVNDSSISTTITYPQADATTSPWWQHWYVRLSDIGVALDDITSITISIAGGNGTLRVDDLRLDMPGCIPALQPRGDLDKNCRVDLGDLLLLAGDWLLKDFAITPAAPDTGQLLAHYEFDGSAVDSAGSNDASAVNAIWNGSGYASGCIELVNSTSVTIPAAVFSSVTDEVTISMWISGDGAEYPVKVNQAIFAAGATSGDENSWDNAAWDIDIADAYGPAWNHYATVKNAATGEMSVYRNGMLMATTTTATEAMEGTLAGDSILSMARFDVGTTPTVKVDDLRIYSYALSQAEIASIAGGSVVQPIEPIYTEYDLSDDGKISLDDFATIAGDFTE